MFSSTDEGTEFDLSAVIDAESLNHLNHLFESNSAIHRSYGISSVKNVSCVLKRVQVNV